MSEMTQKLSRFFYQPSLGLLLVRVTLGAIFIYHGWGKLGNLDMTMGFMESIGLPGFMAYAITAVELLGGLMLILGVLTRFAGVALAIAMAVAVCLVTFPKGGLAGSEYEILLMLASFALVLTGSGKYRLSSALEHGTPPNNA